MAALWVLMPFLVLGDVYKYFNTSLDLGSYLARRVEMYSPMDAPLHEAPGNGRAYIQLELQFKRFPKHGNASLEIEGEIGIAAVASENLNIGLSNGKQQWYCCTKALSWLGVDRSCTVEKLNTVIIQNDPHWVQYGRIKFEAGQDTASSHKVNAHFPITRSGPHILVFSVCDPRLLDVDIKMSGTTVWMNPYGYLPATSYYFMPFYGMMAFLYGVLAIIWTALNCFRIKDIVNVQIYISCVIVLCLVENMVLYFDYSNFNHTGHRHDTILFLGAFISTARRTISRMLIMALSIGFAIVRADLGQNRSHILNYGALYFFISLIHQIFIDLAKVHTGIGDHFRTLLALPVAALDAGCYLFVFISLYHLISMLRVRQQAAKLEIYKSFTKVLLVSVICGGLASLYHMMITAQHRVLEHWKIWWFLDEGMWNVLFTAIFLSICFLFRPSQAAKRFAYSPVLDHNDENEAQEYGLPTIIDGSRPAVSPAKKS